MGVITIQETLPGMAVTRITATPKPTGIALLNINQQLLQSINTGIYYEINFPPEDVFNTLINFEFNFFVCTR